MLRGAEYSVSSNEYQEGLYITLFLLSFYFFNLYLLMKKQYKDN